MYKYEFFNCLDSLIADAKTAILATVDDDGRPKMRWMTPTTLKDRQGFIYSVAAKNSKKIDELSKNPKVEWMIQSRALDRIINIKGHINIIDNPSMKTEILQSIGKRLNVFWKINLENTEFVVLETVLEEAVYFEPMKGRTERIGFGEGDK
ncbi:MAG: pyridoxamine 5'-phosphate oxidase family protein [Clostridiales bacterium]|nr:pyridoxamine 5'-phosphate oxidase family protein [Clostridiales bacterium]